MTTFINKNKVKEPVKTVFNYHIGIDGSSSEPAAQPEDYDYVELMAISATYGAIFKVYNEGDNDFVLYFGIAGDEFDQ